MANIQQLPGAMESPVEQPPHCENCLVKDTEIARLHLRLNDPHWMIQRALALLSKMKGPALALAGASALGLLLSTGSLNGLLERWLEPQPSTAAVGSLPQIRADSPVLPVDRVHPISQPVRVPGEPPGGPATPPPLPSPVKLPVPIAVPLVAELSLPIQLPHGCLLHDDLKPPCHPARHKLTPPAM